MKKLLFAVFFAAIAFAGCKTSGTSNTTETAAPQTTEAPVVSTVTAPAPAATEVPQQPAGK